MSFFYPVLHTPKQSKTSTLKPQEHPYPGFVTNTRDVRKILFLNRLRRHHRRRSLLLLLLVLHLLNILFRNIILLRHPLEHLITNIALHRNLLPATRSLRHRTARRKLLAKLFRRFLQINIEVFETRDFGDVFALVALDALDYDFGGGRAFRSRGLRRRALWRLSFGRLFRRVFARRR